ncbi:MAG: hypothetical protein AUJ34_03420 [Parcubacteria group bacterium CG1_02_41_12]|nr:MAG: hypothetical protein AUJ34_03420 [Parcubacteria group bacterium CG1_02_41_12]PIQ80140.1 MAG: hypothetical protein COV79_01955 [Parcubacteria group bacterium CG11_big_fil_rev_8_21_14_0_20_41_14]
MIFLAYRNNRLFQKYVPKIIEGFPIAGTFVLPAGTELDDKREEYINAVNSATEKGATMFLDDHTCMRYHYEEYTGGNLQWGEDEFEIHLDWSFRSQIESWTGNRSAMENIAWFAKQVANSQPVNKIVIVVDRITDHSFAGDGGNDLRNCKKLETASRISTKMSEAFADAEIISVLHLEEALEYANNPCIMIVADRHCGIYQIAADAKHNYEEYGGWPYPCMLFLLPLESCAARLIDRGDFSFNFDCEEIREKIREKMK